MSQPRIGPARQPSYERGLTTYRAADNATCLVHLARLDHERPTILRIRALTRLGCLAEARAEINVVYANVTMKLRMKLGSRT